MRAAVETDGLEGRVLQPEGGATREILENDELRGLIAVGTERGYLTFEEIASTLEEVEVTKEQVSEVHAHLVEQGVDVIAADGVTAYKEGKGTAEEGTNGRRKQQELDLTVEPSLD